MRLLVLSDIHGSLEHLKRARGLMADADRIIIPGDLTRTGSADEAAAVIETIRPVNANICAVHGNWDRPEVRDFLTAIGYNVHGAGTVIADIGFFGLGGSSPTPMHTPIEYAESAISVFLEKGFGMIAHAAIKILVSHVPPRGFCDRTRFLVRGGSSAVRSFIEQHAIDLCLCGHIHEASGQQVHRGCRIVNPGSFGNGAYALIDIAEKITVRLERL